MFGKRRILVAVLVIVTAGTLLCVVRSLPALVVGRVVQGVSGGVLPLGYAIIRDELRPQRVARGIALLASLLGVGGGLGVLIAGVLVEHLPYTSMFWLQVPAFLIVAFFAHRHLPESPLTTPVRVDWLGAALVSGGLVAALITLTQARRWGLASSRTGIGVLLAVLLLAAWAVSALRQTDPLLDLRLMWRRPVLSTNLVAFLVGVGQFAGFILLPQYVQEPRSTGYGLGASPLISGVYLLPMTVAVALAGFMAGPLEQRVGVRRLLIAGNIFSAGAFVLLTIARGARVEILCGSGPLGLGTGVALAALATLIVANVAQNETGVAAGVNKVARALGGAVGGQLAAAFSPQPRAWLAFRRQRGTRVRSRSGWWRWSSQPASGRCCRRGWRTPQPR